MSALLYGLPKVHKANATNCLLHSLSGVTTVEIHFITQVTVTQNSKWFVEFVYI